MISLKNLPQLVAKSSRRLGRGEGSGRSKTSGRGTKGQKARGRIHAGFEGGQLPLIKRIPLYRGKSRNKSFRDSPLIINLKALKSLPANSIVTVELLVKQNILSKHVASHKVKLLGDGELTQALTVMLPTSKSARTKIEKAGGKVDFVTKDSENKPKIEAKSSEMKPKTLEDSKKKPEPKA